MYEFWYDYIKPKYQDNAKLSYMNTDCFIGHIQIKDVYRDIAYDFEKRFETSNYEVKIPLPNWVKKKLIGLIKYELVGKIMTKFVELRRKTFLFNG